MLILCEWFFRHSINTIPAITVWMYKFAATGKMVLLLLLLWPIASYFDQKKKEKTIYTLIKWRRWWWCCCFFLHLFRIADYSLSNINNAIYLKCTWEEQETKQTYRHRLFSVFSNSKTIAVKRHTLSLLLSLFSCITYNTQKHFDATRAKFSGNTYSKVNVYLCRKLLFSHFRFRWGHFTDSKVSGIE